MWGDCWIWGSAETEVLVFKPLAVSYSESHYLWLEVDPRRLSLSKETVGPDQRQWPGGSHSIFQVEAG